MDLIKKIAQEEEERFKRFYKRYVDTPYARREGIALPIKDNGAWYYHHDINIIKRGIKYYQHAHTVKSNTLFLLNLELKSLREYNIITEKERIKYSKMIRGNMQDLAKIVINNFRNKRVKKYGYANFKL